MKKLLSCTLTLLILISSFTFAYSAYDIAKILPDIQEVEQVINGYSVTYVDENGEEVEIEEVEPDIRIAENSLPSSYNLKDYDRVTSIKNQGSEGMCWTFGSAASIESNILSQPKLRAELGDNPSSKFDVSEAGNAWYYFTCPPEGSELPKDYNTDASKGTNGGNPRYVANGLSAGYGTFPETLMPYNKYSNGYSESIRTYSEYTLKDFNIIDDNNIPVLKEKIMDSGALVLTYKCLRAYENTANKYNTYFDNINNPNYSGGHAVAIVGWDDNFSKENFKSGMRPENNGAWLCKNSWGDYYNARQGYEGYFWISYETENMQFFQFVMQNSDNFDNEYQYNITSKTYARNCSGCANVYTAKSDEALSQISFELLDSGAEGKVKIYKLNKIYSSPDDGTLLKTIDFDFDYPGIHYLDCDDVEFNEGDSFSVTVEKNNGSNLFISMNNTLDEIGESKAYVSLGENIDWYDFSWLNTNIRCSSIKAFTKNINGADKSKLSQSLSIANELSDRNFGITDFEYFTTQKNKAVALMNDTTASQNDVDNATCLLNYAMEFASDDIYPIYSVEDYMALMNSADISAVSTIALYTDIDFDGAELTPMFTDEVFSGSFFGNNHKLSNFKVKSSLFGTVENAKFNNLIISNCTVERDSNATVIADSAAFTTFSGCSLKNIRMKSKSGIVAPFGIADSKCSVDNCSVTDSEFYGKKVSTFVFDSSCKTSYSSCELNNNKAFATIVLQTSKASVKVTNTETAYDYVSMITTEDDNFVVSDFISMVRSAGATNANISFRYSDLIVSPKGYDVNVSMRYQTYIIPDYTFDYDVETKELYINSFNGASTNINVPQNVFDNPISGFTKDFSEHGFSDKDSITSITLPFTIKEIPDGCFENMNNLSQIYLSSGLTSIGERAFANCKRLLSPAIPETVTKIGSYAFDCCSFKTVTLGSNIEEIGDHAFAFTGKTELNNEEITVPDFVINGYSNTSVELYAANNNLKFNDLSTNTPVYNTELFDYSVFCRGDINMDGVITSRDVTLLQQYCVGDKKLSPIQRYNALVNNFSDKINVRTITSIQKYIAGVIPELEY